MLNSLLPLVERLAGKLVECVAGWEPEPDVTSKLRKLYQDDAEVTRQTEQGGRLDAGAGGSNGVDPAATADVAYQRPAGTHIHPRFRSATSDGDRSCRLEVPHRWLSDNGWIPLRRTGVLKGYADRIVVNGKARESADLKRPVKERG